MHELLHMMLTHLLNIAEVDAQIRIQSSKL